MTHSGCRGITAAVIIGRNEGERLVRCLNSVVGVVDRTVYVDSGSIDGSVLAAHAAGSEVVALDTSQPFTAARARNAGLERLRCAGMLPDYVQFVDGDCELQADWISTAVEFLDANAEVAVVSGRLRERFPDASLYNRLCDWEWDTPIGLTKSCGGVAFVRMEALGQIGGFNAELIAGEEPELCIRLRRNGWKVWRLDSDMALHDAAMTRFSQWWKRSRRSGFAAAEGFAMHGSAPERHGAGTIMRALFWGAALPAMAVALASVFGAVALLLLSAYPLQIARLALRGGGSLFDWQIAIFLTFSKFAELLGILEYLASRFSGRRKLIIEYK